MKIFNDACLRFGRPNWARDPELALVDTILENNPQLLDIVKTDIIGNNKLSEFGRKDTPTVEQVMRFAIYKELKNLNYRDLEYAQVDSRICTLFVKLDERRPFSFQVLQKYISRITEESLTRLLVVLNQAAISEGLEDIEKLRTDSTTVKSNIHHPTNNSLVWDCIKTSHNLLKQLQEQTTGLTIRDYRKSAKRNFFKINNTKSADKRIELFNKQLIIFTTCINQVDQVIRNPKKKACSMLAIAAEAPLKELLPVKEQVYKMTYRKELEGEKVPNEEKIFSIYEQHADIIVKGGRQAEFGHKVNLATGKSNLILDCETVKGNPSDKTLFEDVLMRVKENYGCIPRDVATDGGYASMVNQETARKAGVVNIVFNKVVGSLKNITSSKNIETRLKKWRSGIEANISNYKRGFNIAVCNWKGWGHFQAKVLWSAIAYNIRVMTGLLVEQMKAAL